MNDDARIATNSPAQQLSGAGEASGPAVGVDPQGRITAVWSEADKVMRRRRLLAARATVAAAFAVYSGVVFVTY